MVPDGQHLGTGLAKLVTGGFANRWVPLLTSGPARVFPKAVSQVGLKGRAGVVVGCDAIAKHHQRGHHLRFDHLGQAVDRLPKMLKARLLLDPPMHK